jgi:large subunit ribosomal protein L21
MYAVIEIAGRQFKISENQKLFVPKLKSEVGSKVEFDKVLLYSDDAGVKVGKPTLPGMKVEATVLDHVKDDKVIVFKKKKTKGYKVRRGHRQDYTQIEINKIA